MLLLDSKLSRMKFHFSPFLLIVISVCGCSADLDFFKPVNRPQEHNNVDSSIFSSETFIPSHYDIELRVILDGKDPAGDALTAPGKVSIAGRPMYPTQSLIFYSGADISLNTSSIKIEKNDGFPVAVAGVSIHDYSVDEVIIKLTRLVAPFEDLTISFEYIAKIHEKKAFGLVALAYESETGESRRFAVTNLYHRYARHLFPCSDEHFKATHQLTVIRRKGYTSVSNTDLMSSSTDPTYDGWMVDKFAVTDVMSTYLVSFIVSDFAYVEAKIGSITARTHGPNHLIENGAGRYAAVAAANVVNFYGGLFQNDRNVSRVDLVPVGPDISNQFISPRGLYFFSPELLWSQGDSNLGQFALTESIATALLNSWIEWGEAGYLLHSLKAYTIIRGMELINPNFSAPELEYLYGLESTVNSNTNNPTLQNSERVEGFSMIRMVEAVLSPRGFQEGLQHYWKSTIKDITSFCESMGTAAKIYHKLPPGLSMCDFVETYAYQRGQPVVKVSVVNSSHVGFSQVDLENREEMNFWYIPVSGMRYGESHPDTVWLEKNNETRVIQHDSRNWIVANENGTGNFHTIYDDQLLQLIENQLETDSTKFSALTKAKLLDDYFMFAENDFIKVPVAVSLTKYLHHERNFVVWNVVRKHMAKLEDRLSSNPEFALYQNYMHPKLEVMWTTVGVEEIAEAPSIFESRLRKLILLWACDIGTTSCQTYARSLLAQWQSNPHVKPISDLDDKAECAMVSAGGRPAFDFVWELLESTRGGTYFQGYLKALSCVKEPDLINELLRRSLDEMSKLDPFYGSYYLLDLLAHNPPAMEPLLSFMSENLNRVIEVAGGGTFARVGWIVKNLCKRFSTQSQLDQVKAFVDQVEQQHQQLDHYDRHELQLSLKTLEERVKWTDIMGVELLTWLSHQ